MVNTTLYLIPSFLGNPDKKLIAPVLTETLNTCDIIFAEHLKSARHFLKDIGVEKKIDDFEWYELTKDTTENELNQFIKKIVNKKAAIISEAGAPGVADPGAALAKLAHRQNITVVPLPGLSSILMAVMASGMNGQSFAFNGYLPIEKHDRIKAIKELESLAARKNQTQLFIETPYRNNALLQDILIHGNENTLLGIAADISCTTEFIKTKTLREWKNNIPELHKRPAVFIIG